VLADRVAGVEIALDADRFLDDLLRAVVQEALSLTEDAVRLQDGSGWTSTMLAGCRAIREQFGSSPADGVLRWWRGGVVSMRDGRPELDPARAASTGSRDDALVTTLRFTIGEAFPASDSVARFITVLAMMSNDWLRLMSAMLEIKDWHRDAEGLRIMSFRQQTALHHEAALIALYSVRRGSRAAR
jgi:hypothetical protein